MNVRFLHQQRLQVGLRLALVLLTFGAVMLLIQVRQHLLWPPLLLTVPWQAFALLRYLDSQNRHLIRFLEAIRYEDFQLSFPERPETGGSSAALYETVHEIFALFKQNRNQAEQQHRYLQALVEHIDIGLLSVRHDGQVEFINQAAKRLLQVAQLRSLTELAPLYNEEFLRTLREIRHSQKQTVQVESEKSRFSALIYASSLRVGEQSLRLISLQNIDKVLEEKELQAWQSLIKVLTHEIMNSMTPIASLSDTAAGLMKGMELEEESPLADVYDALQTIQRRSIGLMEFVKAYRNLTLIPKPDFRIVPVAALFSRVHDLLEKRLREQAIAIEFQVEPESLTLTADNALLEQVLLNLILNAMDAVKGIDSPHIALRAFLDDGGRTAITVSDNGCGVVDSARDKIFIPFFSTKESGSGIGLAFSRQIMRLHQGHIELAPVGDAGARFVLTF